MEFNSAYNAWVLADANGLPVFLFYADGSIGFPKVSLYARLRFSADGNGIEVTDNTQTWRKIPFTYGTTAPSVAPTDGTVPPETTPI